MNQRTCIPKKIYHDEVLCFLADRYRDLFR